MVQKSWQCKVGAANGYILFGGGVSTVKACYPVSDILNVRTGVNFCSEHEVFSPKLSVLSHFCFFCVRVLGNQGQKFVSKFG